MSEIRALSDSIHRKRKEIDNLRQFIARYMRHYKGKHGCRMTRQENTRLRQLEAQLEEDKHKLKNIFKAELVFEVTKQAKQSIENKRKSNTLLTKNTDDVTLHLKQAGECINEIIDTIPLEKIKLTEEDVLCLNLLLNKIQTLKNSLICWYVEAGISQLKVAESFHLSPARVSQIVKQDKKLYQGGIVALPGEVNRNTNN